MCFDSVSTGSPRQLPRQRTWEVNEHGFKENTRGMDKKRERCVKYLGCLSSSCGFEAAWSPVVGLTQAFSAPPPAYVAPHIPGGSTDSRFTNPVNHFVQNWPHIKGIWSKNLWRSLLMFPPGCGSVRAWTLCATFLSLPLSLQEDGLPRGPVLQREVTDGSAEVLRFGVPRHGFGVAEEQEERVEPGESRNDEEKRQFYCDGKKETFTGKMFDSDFNLIEKPSSTEINKMK